MKKRLIALIALCIALASLAACGGIPIEKKTPLDEYLIAKAAALADEVERLAAPEVLQMMVNSEEVTALAAPYSSLGTPVRAFVIGVKQKALEKYISAEMGNGVDFAALPDSRRDAVFSTVISRNNGQFGVNYIAVSSILGAGATYWTHKDFDGAYYVVLHYGDMNALIVLFSETSLPEVLGASAMPLFLTEEMLAAASGAMPEEFQAFIDEYGITVTEYNSSDTQKMMK